MKKIVLFSMFFVLIGCATQAFGHECSGESGWRYWLCVDDDNG